MKTNSNAAQPQDSQAPDRLFWLWLVAAMMTLLIIAVICTAWVVRYSLLGVGNRLSETQSRIVIKIAEFPGLVHRAIQELPSLSESYPALLLRDRKGDERLHWIRRFPAPEDTGYLLFSGIDPGATHSSVRLIRIADGMTVARWDPDWRAIYKQMTSKKYDAGSLLTALARHPLLLPDGDIVFNTGGSLVRLNTCSRNPVWVLDEVMHHSNEIDVDGNLWVPSVSQEGFVENKWLRDRIRDDALARISTDGHVLDKRSFARILRENGLQAMMSGIPLPVIGDPIHMNQIKIARQNSRHWMRGDLLISTSTRSTVYLYRPSSGKIIWYQTGPWMSQHSVDFVDDHRISVFDNNVFGGGVPNKHAFLAPGDTNRVFVYDFDTKQALQPFAALLAEARPMTISEGRAQILPDGGLFLEETNYGRHLRFTRDRLLWSRVNDYDDQHIGAVSWSRYLTTEEARGPLQALSSRSCQESASLTR